MADRIARGFSRLGIWAAGLVGIAGLTVTGMAVYFNNFGADAILTGLALTGALALAAFVFFRGLGWVLAGFAKD
jgi:hypothetical protein